MARSVEFPSDCESVVRALWDYLDRELDDAGMAAIDAHLAECEHCLAHAAFERHLIDEIRRLRARHESQHAPEARARHLRRARPRSER
jgi:anti-sigma factor (TIGR02949 family)